MVFAGVDPLVSIPTTYIAAQGQVVNAVMSISEVFGLNSGNFDIVYVPANSH